MSTKRLTVSDIQLIREALKMASSRHASCAKRAAVRNKTLTPGENLHEGKSRRMADLRERLTYDTIWGKP